MTITTTTNPAKPPSVISLDEYARLGRAGLELRYGFIIVAIRDGVHGLEIEVHRQRPEEDEHEQE